MPILPADPSGAARKRGAVDSLSTIVTRRLGFGYTIMGYAVLIYVLNRTT